MNQIYKFFIKNKQVYLTTNPAFVDNIINSTQPFIIEPFIDANNLKIILNTIMNENIHSNVIIYNKNIEQLFELFCSNFTLIEAAGGVVENNKNEILLIHRRGFWDLPKGKIDAGESIENAAIREVQEETGLQNVIITDKIKFKNQLNLATYHFYEYKNKNALKVAYWYLMETTDYKLIPQTEEDIEQAIWVKKQDLKNYFSNMYESIKDVLEAIL